VTAADRADAAEVAETRAAMEAHGRKIRAEVGDVLDELDAACALLDPFAVKAIASRVFRLRELLEIPA
jgi:hypothetical protein